MKFNTQAIFTAHQTAEKRAANEEEEGRKIVPNSVNSHSFSIGLQWHIQRSTTHNFCNEYFNRVPQLHILGPHTNCILNSLQIIMEGFFQFLFEKICPFKFINIFFFSLSLFSPKKQQQIIMIDFTITKLSTHTHTRSHGLTVPNDHTNRKIEFL